MADDRDRPRPRARAVADPLLAALEARAEQLARGWAAELVLRRPLGWLGQIPLEALAREAPDLCRALLRAVGSDAALERLLAGEQPERGAAYVDLPAALSGARDSGAVVEAVEVLRGVLWEALLDERVARPADRSRERLLTDAADRLAHVCAALSAAAVQRRRVAAGRPSRFPERPPGPRSMAESPTRIVDERDAVPAGGAPALAEQPVRYAFAGDATGESERSATERRPEQRAPRRSPGELGAELPPGRVRPLGEPPAPMSSGEPAEIAIRDARSEPGPAAWIRTIGAQLERFERDGAPFAVVLLELLGADERRLGAAPGAIEEALAEELRSAGGGSVTREREGRYWLLVPRADAIGAPALASGMERAAAAAAARAGGQVLVASGTAVCPSDGTQAASLAAHADIGLYAARWEARAGASREWAPGEER